MYVGKQKGQHRVDHFLRNKYQILCNVIGKPECYFIFYKASAIIDMSEFFFRELNADGLRLYFATYTYSENVPEGYDDLMTLVLAPTQKVDNFHEDIGLYYTIPPGYGFHPDTSQLEKQEARDWIECYQSNKLQQLNATVDNPAGDTRSIYYTKKQIESLAEEMEYQDATGLKAYLAAIDDEESDYNHQLILDFVLTKKIGDYESDFSIEFSEGFAERPSAGDLDTGSPCPPATCGGTQLP